jgi:energy-coupling factor transport system permease protein
MIGLRERSETTEASLLGRASPVIKLAIALVWLIGLAFTLEPWPPIAIIAVTVIAALVLGRLTPAELLRGVAVVGLAALGIGVFNALFSGSNADQLAPVAIRLGPIRVTEAAAAAGVAIGLRVLAIATVGAVFSLTTDSTRLVDSLVAQARVPERFAFGALAAYQAVPRFGEDLRTLRQARRIRGLRGSWHPRLLVGLLVLAIRHGDRLALAMDARAFGSGPRTTYRPVGWGREDALLAIGAALALAGALALG